MGNWYEYDFSGRNILLVEDNAINLFMQQAMLETVGFKVETAENGKLGVQMYEAFDEGYFDAILMDINMPVMDGWTAAEQIRALHREDAAVVPIIALTTSSYKEDIERSFSVGMNEHLVKPVQPNELFNCIAGFLR